MDINKLAPWNWFKREDEDTGKVMPVRRSDTRRHITHPVLEIHNQIDRMFDEFFRGFGFPEPGFRGDLFTGGDLIKPALDIATTDKEYTITVELPGVKESDISLELVNDTLKIHGEKEQESEHKDRNYYRVERSFGSFQRVLSLPEDADRDGIDASYRNGVMTITIPRKEDKKKEVKKIEVKNA